MLAFIAILNASSLCVDRTDICAPRGSVLEGSISPSHGGQVAITPPKPMRALGARFRAHERLVVTVQPWSSSNGTSGATVHVSGTLVEKTAISGAQVTGAVRIGQMQGGRTTPPQLVEAAVFERGVLKVGTGGLVEVGPDVKVAGHQDLARVRLDVTSPRAIRANGIELAAGTVRIEQHETGTTIGGVLARPQDIGGVLVEQQLTVTLGGKLPKFDTATLARATPLRMFGLPDGEAPAGTMVRTTPGATLLVGAQPVTVCGLALAPPPTVGSPAVTLTTSGPPAHVAIHAKLVGNDVDLGGGLYMKGDVTLRYAPSSCQRLSVEGTLSRRAQQSGLTFAANTALLTVTQPGEPLMRGTLSRPAVVDGFTLTGAVMVRVAPGGTLHVIEGTLAKPAPFEQWQLPANTRIDRSGTHWSFTVARGQRARALAAHRGERVDDVLEGHSDASWTTFTLARPHTPRGTKLAMKSIGIAHATGCVLGDVATAQSFGIFKIPKGSNANLCNGDLQSAEGHSAVPTLQVGAWFATAAFAGDPSTRPDGSTPRVKPQPAATSGYWLQINSLCQGASGIPRPPPPQRWIWVDARGQPSSAADRKELAARASKRGTPCPVTPCCPP